MDKNKICFKANLAMAQKSEVIFLFRNGYFKNKRSSMESLTVKDIDVLLEALKTWEAGDMGGVIFKGLLKVISSKDETNTTEGKRKFEGDIDKDMEEVAQKRMLREETALYIKVKLINMKKAMVLDEAKNIINK